MAYQNGEPVNRYSAQRYHRNELKRRHTPEYYNSYNDYCDAMRRRDQQAELYYQTHYPDHYDDYVEYYTRQEENGMRDYYEKWWKAYSHFFGQSMKGNLKHYSNRKHRHYNKTYCDNVKDYYDYDDCDDPDDYDDCAENRYWEW